MMLITARGPSDWSAAPGRKTSAWVASVVARIQIAALVVPPWAASGSDDAGTSAEASAM